MLCYFPKTVVIMLYMLRIKGSNPFYVTVAGLTNITDLYILNILCFSDFLDFICYLFLWTHT